MTNANGAVTVNLDKPTLWKITLRDVAMLVAVVFIAGGTYAGVRNELASMREEVQMKRTEIASLSDRIGALNDTIRALAVQVAKLEGRLER